MPLKPNTDLMPALLLAGSWHEALKFPVVGSDSLISVGSFFVSSRCAFRAICAINIFLMTDSDSH